MLEQLFFVTISLILFGAMFFKMIKRNDTEYIVILLLEAFGIIVDGVGIIFNIRINIIFKTLIYIFSVIAPLLVLILEHKNIDILNLVKIAKVKFYLSIGNMKKAKDILITIIDKNPKNYNAHKLLATIYEKEGGLRKAIDEYVICIELNKKDYDSYYKIATLLNELERRDDAILMLTNLLEKKPDYYNASITLGDLLIETEKYKEAVAIYTEALKYNPASFELNYELGIAYTMLNDFKAAKEYYEKAAELNSMKYNSKYNLAQIALLYKELDAAEKYFQETLEDEDLQADSYYELAKISLMRGQKDIAIKYANIAIDIDSKRISEKIKKEPLFMSIMTKISIPFNLEEKERANITEKDLLAKEHLENTSDITTNMGYVNLTKDKMKDEITDMQISREKE